jgi:hypothetical protein
MPLAAARANSCAPGPAITTSTQPAGGGVAGTVDLLRRSLRPGGTMLIGEAYWRREPPDQDTVAGCDAIGADGFRVLPELLEQFRELGCDVVEMILADQDNWDRYVAAQWLNTRR